MPHCPHENAPTKETKKRPSAEKESLFKESLFWAEMAELAAHGTAAAPFTPRFLPVETPARGGFPASRFRGRARWERGGLVDILRQPLHRR